MTAEAQRRFALRCALGVAGLLAACLMFWLGRRSVPVRSGAEYDHVRTAGATPAETGDTTQVWAHNLLLRKGSHFRIYLHWMRGQMQPTAKGRTPSLDNPESFLLYIQRGVVDARLVDLTDYLNSGPKSSTLKDLVVENHDGQLQIKGMAHKGIWLPVRIDGDLSPAPGGLIHFHLQKLNVLKVPMKGLFGLFHIEVADMLPKEPIAGIRLQGNDIYFDTLRLLPPPHAHGDVTAVQLTAEYVRVFYGNAQGDESRMAQWHNFLQLTGGTVRFGKLTMEDADLTLIDTTDDPWFDLDLAQYQRQLVYGTTRITQRAGVEMYMPDLDHLPPGADRIGQGVSVDWLKNRSASPPVKIVQNKP